jgi:hypothetical protein
VQGTEEALANRSLDFCNAFWGIADGGYDVLLTRIRGAARTTEELRAFWKERYALGMAWEWYSHLFTLEILHRASIEDDYAKRMSKLAKQPLGRDEIGFVYLPYLFHASQPISTESCEPPLTLYGWRQIGRRWRMLALHSSCGKILSSQFWTCYLSRDNLRNW